MAQVQPNGLTGSIEAAELRQKIGAAGREGAARALEEHYRAGRSIVVWRDGKVVWLKPEEYKHMTASGLGMTGLLREHGIGPLPGAATSS